MKRIFVLLLTILLITFMASGMPRAIEPSAATSNILTTYVLLDTLSELKVWHTQYLPSKQKTGTYFFMKKMLQNHSGQFRLEEIIYRTSKKSREKAALFLC